MEIKFDKRNYRKHNDKNKNLIKKSLKELGAGRSILIDKDNEIIGGNGVYEQAQKLGLKTKVIETDGSELVVVKRMDLGRDDPKRNRLAIMDNSTSDTSENDVDLLLADFSIDELNELGIDIKEKVKKEEGEVEFTEELLEQHNYIVLYFDNEVDWLQAETLFGDFIKKKQALSSKDNYRKIGIGRVVRGADFLKEITKGK